MSSPLMYALVTVMGQAGGTAPASNTPATTTAGEMANKSLLGYLQAGGPVAIILLILSVVAVALIVTNLVMLRRAYLAPPRVVEGLERLVREKQIDLAIQYCKAPENDSFLSRVMAGGLSKAARSQFGMLELKPALEEAASRELDKLDRVTHGLKVLSDLGPMLGLLGTVIGIVGAFAALGSGEGAAKSSKLAGNMSEALVNTALGLSVAIPCLVAHAMFKRRTDRLVADVGDVAEHFAGLLQGQPGATPTAAARPAGAAQRPANVAGAPGRAATTGAGTP
ncbi:MAG: MotA/TolQ/ExbB proton channel family protein [Phycisphaerales bacterium]